MASPSPPKPWETGNVVGASSALLPRPGGSVAPVHTSSTAVQQQPTVLRGHSSSSLPSTSASSSSSSSQPPALPSKPRPLARVVNRTAANYTPYPPNRFGTSSYGTLGSYGGYPSPYNRYGGGMYGGVGGYGGLYGGVGGVGYGMGGFGAGLQGNPNDPNSLTNTMSQSTQATFQIIESIVGAFGGFAQMLESTYLATHSSFFAMVSVAEQFGNLRNTLGSILGIFTLFRWFQSVFARLRGRPLPTSAGDLTPSNFAAFQGGGSSSSLRSSSAPPHPSKKPLVVFILAVFGLPWVMGRLIRALARSHEAAARQQQQQVVGGPASTFPLQQPILDPDKLEFCRVLYDYTPDASSSSSGGTGTTTGSTGGSSSGGSGGAVLGVDLAVKKNDLVAVLSKVDPLTGQPSDWWRCRTRDGRIGFLPAPFLKIIQRESNNTTASSSSASSTSAVAAGGATTKSLTAPVTATADATTAANVGNPGILSGAADISVESFQKSPFY